jgi:Phage terminase, small subunit
MARFEPDVQELRILEAACRTLDDLSRLETALAAAPAVISGSRGNEMPNPLFAQIRSHRLALGRLLTALGLESAQGRTNPSDVGRRMAILRHHGRAS